LHTVSRESYEALRRKLEEQIEKLAEDSNNKVSALLLLSYHQPLSLAQISEADFRFE
jgi:hypothetical protein